MTDKSTPEMLQEYNHADRSADLVRAALEAVAERARQHQVAAATAHTAAREQGAGVFVVVECKAYEKACVGLAESLRALAADRRAINAIVAQVAHVMETE